MTPKEEASRFLSFIREKYSYENRFLSPRDEIFNCISKAIREVRIKIKSETIDEMNNYYKDVISELKKKAHSTIEIYEKDIQNMPERYKSTYLKDLSFLKANFGYPKSSE
jgi:hypothetical protein